MPGSGKSTLGEELANRLTWLFIDIDKLFEASAGSRITAYVNQYGWGKFRREESLLLKEHLKGSRRVIATGGGIVDNSENRDLLQGRLRVVWLRANLQTLSARLNGGERKERPLLEKNPRAIEQLLYRRTPLFASVADYVIDVDSRATSELAEELIVHYRLDLT